MTITAASVAVPLLTATQVRLLGRMLVGPVSLLDCEFSDALTLKRADLVEVDETSNQIVPTAVGRRFLTAAC